MAQTPPLNEKGKRAVRRIIIGFGGLVVLGVGGLIAYSMTAPESTESVVLDDKVGTKDFDGSNVRASKDSKITLPGDTPAKLDSAEIRWGVIPWNSMMGANHANGGPVTMTGSIMHGLGVNLRVIPQDMYGDQRQGLIACAEQMYKTGKDDCTVGYTHTAMMGDAAAWYMADLNAELLKLGDEYRAEIIGGPGRSLGEDAFMGPRECVSNPDACRGLRFAGVQGDGDINSALTWAALNNIPVNPNGSTWDPDAINFMYTGSFDEADKAYINEHTESLPVVRNGKLTGERRDVTIAGTATWTPGDFNVAKQKGGLVKIYSTFENDGQMGNATIGIYKWNQAHKGEVVNWMAGWYQGGYEVRTSDEALRHGGEAAYAIYQTDLMTGKDWYRYYTRRQMEDATGEFVWIGGSQAFVLEEALAFYGINDSAGNPFRRAYEYYGDLAVALWPEDINSYPAYDEVFNPEYLVAVSELGLERGATVQAADQADFTKASTGPVTTIGERNWNIQFETGKDTFDRSAAEDLDELATLLIMAGNTRIEIHGHTDSDGNDETNMQLSENRAFRVKDYLEEQAPDVFRSGRVTVHPHGESIPLESNSTHAGKAVNRRVEVKVLTL